MFKFKKYVSFFFFIGLIFCFSEEAAIEFGGKSGWNNLLFMKNTKTVKGKFGLDAIELTSPQAVTSIHTDMYISFDFNEPVEETGFYSLVDYSIMHCNSEKAKFGNGAGLCSSHSKKDSVRLTPMPGSFFSGESILNSFTIEFWICPQITESGSIIFKWWSSLMDKKNTMYQNITASIINNKMEWAFLNIWQNNENSGLDIKLSGKSNIVPEQWSHHLITYNENTGMLEYRMNGRVESITYLTETGHESSQVFYSKLGAPSDVLIGSKYSGLIDEFKVTRMFSSADVSEVLSSLFEKYSKDGGRIETNIINTDGKNSFAKMLKTEFNKKPQTDLEFFIRASNTPFNWNENQPEWKIIKPNKKIENVTGQFIQLACNIYPSGDGQSSPILHSMILHYEKDEKPMPPARITAIAGDSSVKLLWTPSVSFDAKGYLIYYGEKTGEYFLKGSPIDAGNVSSYVISGLENGRLYFFAIAAYDDDVKEHIGILSKEVWARPLKSKEQNVED